MPDDKSRNMHGHHKISLSVCLLVGLLACSNGGTRDYSDQIRENYLDACGLASGQKDETCECTLEEIEERMTEEEFLELEREGDFLSDPRVNEALGACT